MTIERDDLQLFAKICGMKLNPEQLDFGMRILNHEGKLSVVQQRCNGYEVKLAELEAMRPHWAQGHTTDSLVALSATNALSELWQIMGVDNQTDAVARLKRWGRECGEAK